MFPIPIIPSLLSIIIPNYPHWSISKHMKMMFFFCEFCDMFRILLSYDMEKDVEITSPPGWSPHRCTTPLGPEVQDQLSHRGDRVHVIQLRWESDGQNGTPMQFILRRPRPRMLFNVGIYNWNIYIYINDDGFPCDLFFQRFGSLVHCPSIYDDGKRGWFGNHHFYRWLSLSQVSMFDYQGVVHITFYIWIWGKKSWKIAVWCLLTSMMETYGNYMEHISSSSHVGKSRESKKS